jgi:valyl-tRNA synthetase
MSKSLGNVIDPLEVINGISLEGLNKRLEEGNLDPRELVTAKEGQKKDFPDGIAECGADALRFALVSYTAQSDKINLDIQRVVGYRQWCNKLWNAVRFAMSKLGDDYTPPSSLAVESLPFSCKWILAVLNRTISQTVSMLDLYDFSGAAYAVYDWWQYKFCDIFIEAIKPFFAGDDSAFASERHAAQDALWVCLETGLRLLHPFMPFVTEELWQRLPSGKDIGRKESIMISEYPTTIEDWENEDVERKMDLVKGTVSSLRSLRKQRTGRLPAFALCRSAETLQIIQCHELEIRTLATLSCLTVLGENDSAPNGCAFENVNEFVVVYLEGTLDDTELKKIKNKKDELQRQQEKLQKMINALGYQEKVPAHIQQENADKLAKLMQELEICEKESTRLEAEFGNDPQT